MEKTVGVRQLAQELGQDSRDKTGRTGQPGQKSRDKIAGTGQPEKTVGIFHPGDKTARTWDEQQVQDS